MFEMKNNSCSTCKHGYEISGIDNHRLCGVGYCYLCKTMKHIRCDKDEKGIVANGSKAISFG